MSLTSAVVLLLVIGAISLVRTSRSAAADRPGRRVIDTSPEVVVPDDQVGSELAPSPAQDWPVFASAHGLDLHLPNPGLEAVAYHQASYPDAITMEPRGRLLKSYAGKLFRAPAETDGPRYIVQPQRTGRSTDATTAVDLVAPAEMALYAPIDGTVVVSKRYKLYGQYPDHRIEIKPTDAADARVVIIHLTDVALEDGDTVVAGSTVLGTAREFPFHSVVNDYVGGGDPHIHLEVKEQA